MSKINKKYNKSFYKRKVLEMAIDAYYKMDIYSYSFCHKIYLKNSLVLMFGQRVSKCIAISNKNEGDAWKTAYKELQKFFIHVLEG